MSLVPENEDGWRAALHAICAGGVVAFPTDTVYGVGCDPRNRAAILRIYELKGRDFAKALPLLLSGPEVVKQVAESVPEAAQQLGEALWPGALTLVVPRRADLPSELSAGNTIALRVPDHDGLRAFIAAFGGAIAATSANISGQPDAHDAQQARGYFGDEVEVIVDGGLASGGVPSTVVDCTSDPPRVLRVGAISEERIGEVLASAEGH